MGAHKCSYYKCTNDSSMTSMFRFPRNEKLMQLWLKNCGNNKIAHLPAKNLRNRFICVNHFDEKFVRPKIPGMKKGILLKTAFPYPYTDSEAPDQTHTSPTPGPASKELSKVTNSFKDKVTSDNKHFEASSSNRICYRNNKVSSILQNLNEVIDSSDNNSRTSSSESEQSMDASNEWKNVSQNISLCNITLSRVMAQPSYYLGIPLSCLSLVELLQKRINCQLHYIILVLKKLRLNEPFSILARDFDLDETIAIRIFSRTCWKMAENLKVPSIYNDYYPGNIYIFYCLEIKITFPSDRQDLGECNTLKYLVSTTPHGIINFVSEGFDGRTSDYTIFQESGIMNTLPKGVSVLTKEGVIDLDKSLVNRLNKNNFILIRPPDCFSCKNVYNGLHAGDRARLLDIERLVRRLWEFALFKPCARIDHFLITDLDYAIIICCALMNMQIN